MRPAVGLLAGVLLASSLAAPLAHADEADLVLDLGGITLETRRVTHGTFNQGSQATETVHDHDEEPTHQVTISRDYWVGKFPVTRAQFAKFVSDTRYVTDAEKAGAGGAGWDGHQLTQKKDVTWKSPGFTQMDEHPVVVVSFADATAFVGWASRKTGKHVRLPTEAEWEYAARAGSTTPWYGGSSEAEALQLGWFKPNAGNGTRPVGQKKPNPLGLFDMAGDVYEWCRDVYAPYHDAASIDPEVTTVAAGEPERRVLRGGSWLRDPKRGRSAARFRNAPGSRNADNGFRVVVTSEESLAPGVNGSTGPAPIDFAPSSPLGLGGSPVPNAAGTAGASGAGGTALGPLADGEALRVEAVAHPTDSFSWTVLLASPVASASAVVAWMLLRRKRRPGASPSSARSAAAPVAPPASARPAAKKPAPVTTVGPSGIGTRIGADGFHVIAPSAGPGARVRYECVVKGATIADVVALDGGDETFIYTGTPPTAIRILEVLDVARRTAERESEHAATPSAVAPHAPPPVPKRAPPPPRSTPSVIIMLDDDLVSETSADVPPAPQSSPPPLPAAAGGPKSMVPPPPPSSSVVVPPPPPSSSSAVAPPAPPSSPSVVPRPAPSVVPRPAPSASASSSAAPPPPPSSSSVVAPPAPPSSPAPPAVTPSSTPAPAAASSAVPPAPGSRPALVTVLAGLASASASASAPPPAASAPSAPEPASSAPSPPTSPETPATEVFEGHPRAY